MKEGPHIPGKIINYTDSKKRKNYCIAAIDVLFESDGILNNPDNYEEDSNGDQMLYRLRGQYSDIMDKVDQNEDEMKITCGQCGDCYICSQSEEDAKKYTTIQNLVVDHVEELLDIIKRERFEEDIDTSAYINFETQDDYINCYDEVDAYTLALMKYYYQRMKKNLPMNVEELKQLHAFLHHMRGADDDKLTKVCQYALKNYPNDPYFALQDAVFSLDHLSQDIVWHKYEHLLHVCPTDLSDEGTERAISNASKQIYDYYEDNLSLERKEYLLSHIMEEGGYVAIRYCEIQMDEDFDAALKHRKKLIWEDIEGTKNYSNISLISSLSDKFTRELVDLGQLEMAIDLNNELVLAFPRKEQHNLSYMIKCCKLLAQLGDIKRATDAHVHIAEDMDQDHKHHANELGEIWEKHIVGKEGVSCEYDIKIPFFWTPQGQEYRFRQDDEFQRIYDLYKEGEVIDDVDREMFSDEFFNHVGWDPSEKIGFLLYIKNLYPNNHTVLYEEARVRHNSGNHAQNQRAQQIIEKLIEDIGKNGEVSMSARSIYSLGRNIAKKNGDNNFLDICTELLKQYGEDKRIKYHEKMLYRGDDKSTDSEVTFPENYEDELVKDMEELNHHYEMYTMAL